MSTQFEPLIQKISRSLEESERLLEQTRVTLQSAGKLLRQHNAEYQLDQRLKMRSEDALKTLRSF